MYDVIKKIGIVFIAAILLVGAFQPVYGEQTEPSWEVIGAIYDVMDIIGYDTNSASDSIFIHNGEDLIEWGILNTTALNTEYPPVSNFIKMDWNDDYRWMAWARGKATPETPRLFSSELVIFYKDGTPFSALKPYGDLESNDNRSIFDIQWCPGSPYLAVAYGDGTVIVYNIEDSTTLLVKEEYSTPIHQIEWNPGGSLLAILCGNRGTSSQELFMLDIFSNSTWRIRMDHDDIEYFKWNNASKYLYLLRPSIGIEKLNIMTGLSEPLIETSVLGFSPSPSDSTVILVDETTTSFLNADTGEIEVHSSPRYLSTRLGWSSDGAYAFTIDRTDIVRFWSRISVRPSPKVGIISPEEDSVVSGHVNITGWASSSASISGGIVYVKVNTLDWYSAIGFEEWRYILDSTQFPDGYLIIRVRAEDPNGSSDIIVRRIISRNTAKPNERPSVSISSPQNGTDVGPIVHVTGFAHDDVGVESIQFKVINQFWRNVALSDNGMSISWEQYVPIFYWEGEVRLSFRAFDGVLYSEEVTITVEKSTTGVDENMTVVVEYPKNGAVVASDFRVSGRVDGPKPDTVIVLMEDDTTFKTEGTSLWFIDFNGMDKKSYTLRFRAIRGDYLSPWLLLSITVGESTEPIDNPPRISLISPLNGTVLTESIDVVGKAVDDYGVEKVEYRIADGEWNLTLGTNDWNFTLDVEDYGRGYLWVEVRGFDGTHYSQVLKLRYYVDRPEDTDPVEVVEPILNDFWVALCLIIVILMLIGYIMNDRRKQSPGD